jgi:hypothetical protein
LETYELEITSVDPTDAECRIAALEWVNDFRTDFGFEVLGDLRKGFRFDAGMCVLAASLMELADPPSSHGAKVGGGRYSARQDGDPAGTCQLVRDGRVVDRPVSENVALFARRFDEGRYPDLVAE